MILIPRLQRWFLPRCHFIQPHIPFNLGAVAGSTKWRSPDVTLRLSRRAT
jgi:hypothetical protein